MEKGFFEKQFCNYYSNGTNGWMMNIKSSHKYRFNWAIAKMKEHKNEINNSLELACASGDFTEHILHNFPNMKELRCVDLCDEAIAICQTKIKNQNVHFETCELPNINYESNYFDTIWCMDVIYYLDIKEQYQLVHEVNRMLRDDGVALFIIPYNLRNCSILRRCVKKYMNIIDEEYNYNALWGTFTSLVEGIYKKFIEKRKMDALSNVICKVCILLMQSEILMNIVHKINMRWFKDKKSHMMIIAKRGEDFEKEGFVNCTTPG